MFAAIAAVIGAAVGSFLNVCIYRVPRKMSIASPPSACPHCGRQLSWYENVPFVAWLVLRGRCRTCGARLGVRYLVIEALTAVMFAAAAWYYGPTLLLASRLSLGCVLIVLFAIDLEHQLLPHIITFPAMAVGFALSALAGQWLDSLLGIVVGYGVLEGIFWIWWWLRHEEALGGGDPPMLGMIGAFLGWRMTVMTMFFGSVAGSVFGLGLITLGRGHMKSLIPFGCFLAIGAAVAATIGPALLAWYLGLM
ncbi:MAG TPA: prepilin peptidase [Vicinamibacterales bacterium]|nr:prepilin peptidase [Vicinamibacterales bacterium]